MVGNIYYLCECFSLENTQLLSTAHIFASLYTFDLLKAIKTPKNISQLSTESRAKGRFSDVNRTYRISSAHGMFCSVLMLSLNAG